jgi:predicted RNA binding protein YcfA (HicA-like mRNA interferase family)
LRLRKLRVLSGREACEILSGREACEILSRHDFAEVRRRGSHIIMQKKLANGTITVPVPDHGTLRTGTLRAIIRQSGVARTEFET